MVKTRRTDGDMVPTTGDPTAVIPPDGTQTTEIPASTAVPAGTQDPGARRLGPFSEVVHSTNPEEIIHGSGPLPQVTQNPFIATAPPHAQVSTVVIPASTIVQPRIGRSQAYPPPYIRGLEPPQNYARREGIRDFSGPYTTDDESSESTDVNPRRRRPGKEPVGS